jgi:hypothetical protein
MAPKTPQQKTVNFENDSFEVWLQKTNVISSEQGDLNALHTDIYTPDPLNPDAKLMPGKAYVQLTQNSSGVFLPSKVLGVGTGFDNFVNVGDLIGMVFSGLAADHVWNDKKTYLLQVTGIVSDTELLVSPVYAGADLPTFPITAPTAESIFVKQVNLVDSANKIYTISKDEIRRHFIRAIGMS